MLVAGFLICHAIMSVPIDVTAGWSYKPDPQCVGVAEQWFRPGAEGFGQEQWSDPDPSSYPVKHKWFRRAVSLVPGVSAELDVPVRTVQANGVECYADGVPCTSNFRQGMLVFEMPKVTTRCDVTVVIHWADDELQRRARPLMLHYSGELGPHPSLAAVPLAMKSGNMVYLSAPTGLFMTSQKENGQVQAFPVGEPISVGCRARALLFLGHTDSVDIGHRSWYGRNFDYSRDHFIGDDYGSIEIRYADNAVDRVPLVYGATMWYSWPWDAQAYITPHQCREPFESNSLARQTLTDSLKLNPTYRLSTEWGRPRPARQAVRYFSRILVQDEVITDATICRNSSREGVPQFAAITVEGPATPHRLASLPNVTCDSAAAITIARDDCQPAVLNARIEKLQRSVYTFLDSVPEDFPVTVPEGYDSPRVSFRGDRWAHLLNAIFYRTVSHALPRTILTDGRVFSAYNDDEFQAPYYQHYDQGLGLYNAKLPPSPEDAWSRDTGRTMFEAALLGLGDRVRASASRYDLDLHSADIAPLPHAPRVFFKHEGLRGQNAPNFLLQKRTPLHTTTGKPVLGMPEIDGHGLYMLGRYGAWISSGRDAEWLEQNWETTQGLADWIVWSIDNPFDLSKRGMEVEVTPEGVLWGDSECTRGGRGLDIYGNSMCRAGLIASAEMAKAIGKHELADKWIAYAERMRIGFLKSLVLRKPYGEDTLRFGPTWKYVEQCEWGTLCQQLGPLIALADIGVLTPADERSPDYDAESLEISRASFDERIHDADRNKRYDFMRVVGYGHGFITQAALLLDRTADYTQLIENMAKYAYDSRIEPYQWTEGSNVHPSGRFWYRVGFMGGFVHFAECLKAIRIVIGIDGTRPDRTLLVPRPPTSWNGISVNSWPIVVLGEGGCKQATLSYDLNRTERGWDLEVKSTKPIPTLSIRIGPFPADCQTVHAELSQRGQRGPLDIATKKSGDATWVYLPDLHDQRQAKVSVRAS